MKSILKKPSSDSFILTKIPSKKKLIKSNSVNNKFNINLINVLIIGSGGREHALAWKINESKIVNKCYITPGNGGTKLMDGIINLSISKYCELECISNLVYKYNINLVIIGPEKYLEMGIVDYLNQKYPNVMCFGPNKMASKIEWDKIYSKQFMINNDIPTPDFKIFYNHNDAYEYINQLELFPIVIKAGGLANGKGVFIAKNYLEAIEIVQNLMLRKIFGNAGNIIIIEEYIPGGKEMSLLGFTDGTTVQVMPIVYDYKKLLNYNYGPNTGGMGGYCNGLKGLKKAKKYKWILQRTIDKLRESGIIYKGVLYAGLIKDPRMDNSIQVLEFNARFGDPETQILLSLYIGDLCQTILDCCKNKLKIINKDWLTQSSIGVIISSTDYCRNQSNQQKLISFNNTNYNSRDCIKIFHSNTKFNNKIILGQLPYLITTGGRILCITATGFSLNGIRKLVYNYIKNNINISNIYYRTDIGQKPLNIIILGSTNGSNLKYLLENCVHAPINILKVISDRKSAGILTLAELNNISTSLIIKKRGESRENYDKKLINEILNIGIEPDLICLIGWMKILSSKFLNKFSNKIYNVHPSLLPNFAGGMDLDVHNAVLMSGVKESGCTIHKVTEDLDNGPIIIQKKCPVYLNDTRETLKKRVQELEGQSWLELFYKYQNNNLNNNNNENYSEWIDDINQLMKNDLINRNKNKKDVLIMKKSFNHFGSIIPIKNNNNLVVCTDGVGSKLIIAKNYKKLYNLGIDLVAMCINDLYCCGAYPLAFVDYIGYDTAGKNKLSKFEKREIINGIIDGCRQSDCYLLGGETAELSNIYQDGLFDLVGTAIGQVKNILPKKIISGDILIGFPSNGIHSNGFTLIRKLIKNKPSEILIDELLRPTKIYKDTVDLLHNEYFNELKALIHVTGGGIEFNIKRLLPEKLNIKLNYCWNIPKIFKIIEELLIQNNDNPNQMYNIFNMGIGLIAIMSPLNKKEIPIDGIIIGYIY